MSEITGNRKARRARKWTEAQARAALQAWRKSGQSIVSFRQGCGARDRSRMLVDVMRYAPDDPSGKSA